MVRRWRWWLSTPSRDAPALCRVSRCTTPCDISTNERERARETDQVWVSGCEKRQRDDVALEGGKEDASGRGWNAAGGLYRAAASGGEGSQRGASRDRSNSPLSCHGYWARRSMVGGKFSKTQLVCALVVLYRQDDLAAAAAVVHRGLYAIIYITHTHSRMQKRGVHHVRGET